MLRLIQLLIYGHTHKWKIIETVNVFERGHNVRPIDAKYMLQCEHCGDIKSRYV